MAHKHHWYVVPRYGNDTKRFLLARPKFGKYFSNTQITRQNWSIEIYKHSITGKKEYVCLYVSDG